MPIALSEDHKALAETVSDFLAKNQALTANRELLEADTETRPAFWSDLAKLGWLGLHLPEEHGGSGFGLPELVVVVEQLGRSACPGPFVPTVIASATIAAGGSDELKKALLPGLADGTTTAAIALSADIREEGGALNGTVAAALGGATADLILVPVGDDVAVIDGSAEGVSIEVPRNIDPARRAAKVTLTGAVGRSIPGGNRMLLDFARLLLAAEATGVAALTTEMAAQYARDRIQFGRPIGTYQAIKHHCADMAVALELSTSAVWDAARAASHPGDSQLEYSAAIAAALAVPAAV